MVALQGYYDGQKIQALEAIQAKKNKLGKRRWQRNMQMLDANMILRYLLDDNQEMADEAEDRRWI